MWALLRLANLVSYRTCTASNRSDVDDIDALIIDDVAVEIGGDTVTPIPDPIPKPADGARHMLALSYCQSYAGFFNITDIINLSSTTQLLPIESFTTRLLPFVTSNSLQQINLNLT